jgi:peptidoglycan hydrolase-like amidase
MKKAARLLLAFLILILFVSTASADELLDIQRQIDQKNQEYSSSAATLDKIKKQIASLSSSVYTTQAQLNEANKQVVAIREELAKIDEDLNRRKDELRMITQIRDQQVRYLYKHPGNSPLELFIISSGFEDFNQLYGLQNRVVGTSKDLISVVNAEVQGLVKTRSEVAAARDELEKTAAAISAQLASLQRQLSYQSNRQNSVSYQLKKIESTLKDLTQQQKNLIAARLAASQQPQTVGDQVPPSVSLPDPGFSPAYALASYGYPHRVGMNQYGAYGRAKAGQDYQTILRAYYTGVSIGAYPTPSTIVVNGCNKFGQCFNNQVFDFEDYLKHIYEMPASWPAEALKAQAVAARTYAVRYGSPICPSESCQVIKYEYNAPAWQQAVDATRGIVITYAGAPISAWYSSTDGGYTLSAQEVWGDYVPYAVGRPDFAGSWPAGAYDKDSPWFHKPWGGACGNQNYPWLNKEEMTDLFDALILSKRSSSYNQYLSPTDGCLGQSGWSHAQVIGELNRLGVPSVGNLGNIFVGFDGAGHTSSVTIVSSNYSALTFSGSEFSAIFNLRSPGTRVLYSNLYDVILR